MQDEVLSQNYSSRVFFLATCPAHSRKRNRSESRAGRGSWQEEDSLREVVADAVSFSFLSGEKRMTRKECTLTKFRVSKWCPYNIMMCFSKTCPNGSWVMLSIFNQTSCFISCSFRFFTLKTFAEVEGSSFFFFLLQSLFYFLPNERT